jgi:hypothetical protein
MKIFPFQTIYSTRSYREILPCNISISTVATLPTQNGLSPSLCDFVVATETLHKSRSLNSSLAYPTLFTHNSFSFNDEFFLQIKGCAMGSRFSPSYANLVMDQLEHKFLANYPLEPLSWPPYIDDIFLLWPHGNESLDTFSQCLCFRILYLHHFRVPNYIP